MRFARTAVAALLTSTVVIAGGPASPVAAEAGASSTVFINEFHYDNAGDDTGEFIEVAGPAGTDLTGWSLELYNGSNGLSYNTIPLAGALADQSGGYGFVVENLPSNGLQNGAPDGIALVGPSGVVQFLSYEGSFTANDGPATGITSTDIGVSEAGSTPIGDSLQLTGTGAAAGDFTWTGPTAATPGAANTGQSFAAATIDPFINEFHYDNAGDDTDEFIEVAGPAGTDLAGWSLVLYNGSNGTLYNNIALGGVLADQSGGYGFAIVDLPANGLQNGSPDGIALVGPGGVVQFLSYEGSFTANDGPATGITSTDIGVAEGGSTPIGDSLQLTGTGTAAGDFTWTGPTANTRNAANAGQTFGDAPATPRVVVNEIDYDQASTDTTEFAELYNGGGADADLTGWTLEFVNGSNGTVDLSVPLSGSLAVGDHLVVCGNPATVANCDIDAGADTNLIQNGAPDAVRLLDSGGATVDAVSYEGDVAGAVEGSGAGLVDDPDAGARSIARVPDGTDTDQNAADFVVGCPTPGEANVDDSNGCGDLVFIHEIQGSGAASELVGRDVTIEGVVVGDYEGPSPALRGFYVQEEDADVDGDPTTSEGIFVFHGSEDTVNLGDLVRVTGAVDEFQDQTQLGFPSSIEVLSSGNTVTPAAVTLPLASADALEAVEGMLVTVPQTLYVTEFFQLGRFGQVVVSSGDRLTQPTQVAEPGADANAVQAANDLNRLIIDDADNGQNADPIVFGRGGNELTASNTLRGGDTLTDPVGVMTYTWAGNSASGNAYRLRPVGDLSDAGLVPGGGVPVFEAANPRPTAAPAVGGDVQVASFNVLNYFLTPDTSDVCGPTQDQDCRGADSVEEFDRQRAKLLPALAKLDADVIGIIEMENTPGVSPEADLAAGVNAETGSTSWSAIDAAAVGGGVVGTDAIRVGMIYDSAAVEPVGDPALLDFSLDSLGQPRSRTAVAQTFRSVSTGAVFTAVVNHFKSKSGSEIDDSGAICSTDPTYPDCDQGDGQGYFNAIRTTHASELVDWLATDPTGSGSDHVIVLGDFNSYAMEDPIDVLGAAGYVDLAPSAYSYVFDGQWGTLDYLFGSPSVAAAVTGYGHYHINADEPSVLDYDTAFKTDRQIDLLYAPDEFRTSDHDPALVGLDLEVDVALTLDWAIDRVAELRADGTLHPLKARLLTATLERAERLVERGATSAARAMIGVAVFQLELYVWFGALPADDAAPLIDALNAAIEALPAPRRWHYSGW